MVEGKSKSVLLLVLSLVFILILLGFASACVDPCNPSCQTCGNHIKEGTEQCDNGTALNGVPCNPLYGSSCTYCNSNCETAIVKNYCGDWTTQVNEGEECDDGNNLNGDGCSATCKVEHAESVCGNNLLETGEQCDKGLLNGHLCWAGYGSSCTYCSDTCQSITITNYCGDGIKQECEECDDGNTNNTDGCTNDCKINNPPEPTCEYNVGINYQYSHSNNTGINIGYESDSNWIDTTPVNLTSNTIYDVKVSIKNFKESPVNNLNILFKIDNNILNNSYKNLTSSLTQYQKININTSQIGCGYHNISVEISKENCNDLNLSDNYASRQIYVSCAVIPPTPNCDDSNACTTDIYNGTICLHTSITCNDNNASTTDSCNVQTGCIYTPIIIPPIIPPCNGEECCTNNGFVQFCDSNWKCSSWSQCSNGVMTRKCVDTNNCDISYNKPYEQTNCKSGVSSNALVDNTTSNNFWLIVAGIIIFIVLLIILINML